MATEPADGAATTADDIAAQQVAQDVADSLMSPYCPGRSISSCPSEAARDLEADILAQAQSGKTREQIETELVERFGEDRVGSAYSVEVVVVTALLAVAAIILLVRAAKRWAKRSGAESGSPATATTAGGSARIGEVSQAELDRLDDALDDLDEF